MQAFPRSPHSGLAERRGEIRFDDAEYNAAAESDVRGKSWEANVTQGNGSPT